MIIFQIEEEQLIKLLIMQKYQKNHSYYERKKCINKLTEKFNNIKNKNMVKNRLFNYLKIFSNMVKKLIHKIDLLL